jgi:hypothetical protein
LVINWKRKAKVIENSQIGIFKKLLKLTAAKNSIFNPFTGDFDMPKRKCSNGLFWFFFDKVRYILSKISTLVASQKMCFALSRCGFEKICSTNFTK